ncbi:MAG: ABC transporter ATP-binding protein [Gammaproteobacteria bacterium GWE2_37_16]|nr:MAG: ABC transporter ATP-binding protein [Gammaproteobacteria bacterium GWE2_37_16]
MSNLITLENISLAFGLDALLDKVKLQITTGERVCLIGRNGAGKSSLLRIIDGTLLPDGGQVWRKPSLKLARLEQELPQTITGTAYEFVAEGLAKTGKLLASYHKLIQRLEHGHNADDLIQLEKIQTALDANHGWQFEQQIKTVLERLALDPDKPVNELSGGWQRRAALAKALVSSPELLLLDEPTNHLDIEAIQWLEDQLLDCKIGLLFITHDRALLQRLATRIIELDRGQLTSWPGDYANFLRRKEEMLHAEEQQNKLFDKKLAQEEVWIRQGIKARRTRNEGRVRALKALRIERRKRRELEGKAKFNINQADKSGQLVIEADNISHSYDDKDVIKNFSLRIMRGDRIGLIGPNGVGKSTLLNILLGKITPQHGTVTLGTKLDIAYFDQLRKALDLEKTVLENVAPGSDFIEINGQKRHIISYLADFLFSPERSLTPAKALSGGESNRLLLARLFSLPANLLVLDEPTNDLDIETLELLEELLSNYPGTLLLVSHDRIFLDNIVTSTLVFEGKGNITEYIGGYSDWQQQIHQETITKNINKTITKEAIEQNKNKQIQKLNYLEQKELASLLKKIDKMETEKKELEAIMAKSEFYQQNPKTNAETLEKFKKVKINLEIAYKRWSELE